MSGIRTPDWAELLAKQWVDPIRETYRNKGNDGSPSRPIVTTTANELVKPIDNAFGHGLDYDSPDFKMREVLKKNVWDFSVAKNYNDNIRLNNLLLDGEGKLRSWSDFKHEAQKVVGHSNRYLKTEHNTVVAGAQMSRLWQTIQANKDLFPFAQFDVVEDGRTSDICEPLSGVVVKVDDPMLKYYFPPNHFNCRTTVRKLRKGPATAKYERPGIPDDFKNNVGESGEIFTRGNAYFKNTPDKVIKDFHKERQAAKRIEIKEWIQNNIKKGNNVFSGFSLSRKALRNIDRHIADPDLKDIVKEIKPILKAAKLIKEKPLDPKSHNYKKKQKRGVIGYQYYKITWREQMFRLNVEVYENGDKKPYAINLMKKNEG